MHESQRPKETIYQKREMNDENQDEFLSIPEVATRLRLSRATIYRWIDEGRLPALKIGKNIRLRADDVDQLLEASWTVGGGSGGWSDEDGGALIQ